MTSIKLKLPNLNGNPTFVEEKNSVVLIGANGSGKTRMSVWIEFNNTKNCPVHRISAQKSLNMPLKTKTSDIQSSQDNFLYGTESHSGEENWRKMNFRYNNHPSVHLLDDFSKLMAVLFTDAFQQTWEEHEENRKSTIKIIKTIKLDKIKTVWENVITNKILNIKAGKIEASNKKSINEIFNGAEMSDGERAIFYFIGVTLCVPENSVIIIDEPENHLHKAILIRLWNAIEAARPDCMFVYITHDLDFAVSRNNSQIVWVKDMPKKDVWDYELLSQEDFPLDELSLEIRGSRQDVLLVEGKEKSIDKRLYPLIFTNYNVIPVEGCDRVISFTKAFNQLNEMHYCKVRGIIDRDRRSDEEIVKLNQCGVFCPEVAEVESLFLLPAVIRMVAESLQRNPQEIEKILDGVKQKTFDFLAKNIDEQALLFTRQKVQNNISGAINKNFSTIDDYKATVGSIPKMVDVGLIYEQTRAALQKIIYDKNYLEALKFINNKGLLNVTGLPAAFGWRQDDYIAHVIRLLTVDGVSEELVAVFKQYIKID